jgi:hypothetical protein
MDNRIVEAFNDYLGFNFTLDESDKAMYMPDYEIFEAGYNAGLRGATNIIGEFINETFNTR